MQTVGPRAVIIVAIVIIVSRSKVAEGSASDGIGFCCSCRFHTLGRIILFHRFRQSIVPEFKQIAPDTV